MKRVRKGVLLALLSKVLLPGFNCVLREEGGAIQ